MRIAERQTVRWGRARESFDLKEFRRHDPIGDFVIREYISRILGVAQALRKRRKIPK
jgi:hypothetical protein